MSSPTDSDKRWVIIQITSLAEKEKNLDRIVRSVHRILKSPLSVFIPAANQKVREDNQIIYYLDGYLFIEYNVKINYNKLNGSPYFEMALFNKRTGYYTIPDSDVEPLRQGVAKLTVRGLEVGDEVKVLKGTFKNLTGQVSAVYDKGENVQINLKLASKPVLIDYPASYLVKI